MIEIKENTDDTFSIFKNKKLKGILRNYCCGVDFRMKNKNATFSINNLKIGKNDAEILVCVKSILKLKIPKKDLHWNFSFDVTESNKKFKKYQEDLFKYKS